MKIYGKSTIFSLFSLLFYILLFVPSQAQILTTTVTLTGNVLDAVSREPVMAFLIVSDETGKKIAATRSNGSEDGAYNISGLKPGHTYTIDIQKPNYFKEKHTLVLANTDKYENISRDFLIKPMAKNVKIPIPVPPFELNKSKLRFGAEEILNDFLSTLINNPQVKVQIQCFPDNDNDKQENIKLSEERCKSLLNYFVTNGIDMSRITINGSNSTDPKNPPPAKKMAKGKRYIGSTYLVVEDF